MGVAVGVSVGVALNGGEWVLVLNDVGFSGGAVTVEVVVAVTEIGVDSSVVADVVAEADGTGLGDG